MKGNRNKQTTKYGKKETMEGQESSMSLASGMHCLGLPFAGTCSLLLSLNKQMLKVGGPDRWDNQAREVD
jgi:hypothetical protein